MFPTDALALPLSDPLPEPQTSAELTRESEPPEPAPPPPALSPPAARLRLPRAEPLTPFVAWTAADRVAPAAMQPEGDSLLDGYLNRPDTIIDRLLDPARVPALVTTSALITTACAALYEATVVGGFQLPTMRALYMGPVMVLLAQAAALGPAYAAGILASARIPVARLGAALLAATTTGALLLAASAPALYVVIGYDREWFGPLLMVAAFALAGLAAGRRLHHLLLGMAERLYQQENGPTARLCPADAERAALVARLACVAVGFTLTLVCWTSAAR